MRKFCSVLFAVSIILLMVSQSFAQTARDGTPSEGKSSFTNIAVRGLNQVGTTEDYDNGLPGYIEMTSSKGDIFYLWIDYNGNLRIASETEVGYLASPSTVGWSDASGPIIGSQQ